MSDPTNDIDALLRYLDYLIGADTRWAESVRALVAERNGLKQRVAELQAQPADRDLRERDGYIEGNRQTLRALAEANEIAARYKRERDEAHAQLRAEAALIAECLGGRLTAKSVAKGRGWKCFNKGGGA